MLIVRSGDITLRAPTPKGIVSLMRRVQWNAPSRKLPYMEEVAERVLGMTGRIVRTSSPAAFVEDLEVLRLITVDRDAPALATTPNEAGPSAHSEPHPQEN